MLGVTRRCLRREAWGSGHERCVLGAVDAWQRASGALAGKAFRTFVPLRITLPKGEPFSGTISTDRLGPLQATTVDCDRGRVDRTPQLIARDSAD